MTTFYICRHGQTENNKNQRLSGWIDTPLTDKGVQDAMSAASKLRGLQFDKIISSDLGRAFVTAYIIAKEIGYSPEIVRSKDLREVNYGDLANMPYESYPTLTPVENATYITPNGESLVQMQQRVMPYIKTTSLAAPDATILLVAHDGTINAIRATFGQENMGIADTTQNPHDYVAKFEWDSDQIVSFAEVGI